MESSVTVCFYLIIGIGVAAALWLSADAVTTTQRLFRTLTAPFFWPLYVPTLLAAKSSNLGTTAIDAVGTSLGRQRDNMAITIAQVETELDQALQCLDGWAEDVLAGEQERITELRMAWRQQAQHIRELDQLLQRAPTDTPLAAITSPDPNQAAAQSGERGLSDQDTRYQSQIERCERTRHENVLKLRQVRRELYDELMATLAWVRELVSMIHLAKYTGEPASRAVELVQQIAAAIEGVSEAHHCRS